MAQSGTASVTLQNRKRRLRVLNLPYKVAGLQFCVRQLVGRVTVDPTTGVKGVKGANKRLSDSLTLLGKGQEGDTIHLLPPGVLDAPEVAAAIKARDVRAIELNAEETDKLRAELRAEDERKVERAKAREAFLERKKADKAARALAEAKARSAKPAPPTEEEKAAAAAERKRLAEEKAAAEKAAAEAAAEEAKASSSEGKKGRK